MRRRDFLAVSAAALAAPALISSSLSMPASAALKADHDAEAWAAVFAKLPPALRAIVDDPEYQIQLSWRRLSRDANGGLRIRRLDHGVDPKRWFSAASVSKLPMALLMAERLSAHGLEMQTMIRLNAPPATGEWPADEPLSDSFLRGTNRTFTVSENVPFNRWYEYLGGDAIHTRLAALGYPNTRLIGRLGSSDHEANRRTGGGALIAPDGSVVESTAPMLATARSYPFGRALAGRGWQNDDGSVTPGPRDFSFANFMPITDSLGMLQAFLLPDSVPSRQRWKIDGALRAQLLHALGLRPRESEDPRYDEAEHYDGYARWFLVGDGKQRYPDGVRVLGKSGMAYGYLSEVAYIHDSRSGAECLLGAAIHVNKDGIYNDDRYEYDEIGIPFLAALGRAVLEVERDARAGGAPSVG